MEKTQKKSFWALIVTQFFGAYNDNFLKTLVTLLVVAWVDDTSRRNSLVSASAAIFGAPFLIFSMIPGRMPDPIGKPNVIRTTKSCKSILRLSAIPALLFERLP